MVREALKDLSPEELRAPPKPYIAWLVWHLSRVQDANFSGLMERPQLWIADGWHARFNMPPDPKDYGSGHRHTREQVGVCRHRQTTAARLPRRCFGAHE